jgi:hypothetical protein
MSGYLKGVLKMSRIKVESKWTLYVFIVIVFMEAAQVEQI